MKTRIVFIVFCCVTCAVNAQATWDYPVKPGSTEWASFRTGQQRLEVCQIPQEVLEALSTKDLAEICLNYPLFIDYAVSNNERKAISAMIERFNGLKELSKRTDGAQELISIYENYPVLTQVQLEPSKEYDILFKLPFLELLLSDEVFIQQLDSRKANELEKMVLSTYERKLEHKDVYSLWNIKKTFLLGAVAIAQQGLSARSSEEQEIVKRYIENYRNADANLLTEISKIISNL